MELIAKPKVIRDLGDAGAGIMKPELGAFDATTLDIVPYPFGTAMKNKKTSNMTTPIKFQNPSFKFQGNAIN